MIDLSRLRERKIIHWAVAYLAGAWLLLQVLDLLAQPFAWPALIMRAATVLLGIGFFAALIVAWYHGEKGKQRATGVELMMLAGILAIAAAAVAFVGRTGTRSPAPAGATSPAASSAVAEQGSIAVLPFTDMSEGHDQEYFTDGLTEELLNVLAQIPELRVASRTSAFAFKGRQVSIDSIALALHVANVLEGSVRRAGNRLRITAQLIDAKNGYHLWSEQYDRDAGDVFAVQDEIAHSIVQALQLRLGGGRAGAPLAKEETNDPQAHSLLLQALQLARSSDRPSLARAVVLLEQAVKRDPQYARAYAELGRNYTQQAYLRQGPREALGRKAKAAIDRALALDPDLAQGHYALAVFVRDYQMDVKAAERHLRRALELNPGLAVAHTQRGWLLGQLGRTAEAVAETKRAVELDPLSSGMHNNLGAMYTYDRQFERGIEEYTTALALLPDPTTQGNLALSYALVGRQADAVATAEAAYRQAPQDQFCMTALAYAYALAGRRADAERMVRALEAAPEPSPYLVATAYAGLGEHGKVLPLLERAVAEHDPAAGDLGVDPVFATYRQEPRVLALLGKMGVL